MIALSLLALALGACSGPVESSEQSYDNEYGIVLNDGKPMTLRELKEIYQTHNDKKRWPMN